MMGLPRDYVRIDEEQFAKLVELLTPGYELAKAYVEEMRARKAASEIDGMDQTQTKADDADKAGEADEGTEPEGE